MKRQLLTTIGVVALGIVSYAKTITFMQVKTVDGTETKYRVERVEEVSFVFEEEHPYVDLGLPSGILWATCNVGAGAPEGYGSKFAYGGIVSGKAYQFYSSVGGHRKYCSDDNLSTLLPEDDAATANWGWPWRMPTGEELDELMNNCEYSWILYNQVYGAKFTGPNGNFVFFPAAGGFGSGITESGYGCYRSSSLTDMPGVGDTYTLFFSKTTNAQPSADNRSGMWSVRPVRTK